jgi:hypothetical protein
MISFNYIIEKIMILIKLKFKRKYDNDNHEKKCLLKEKSYKV